MSTPVIKRYFSEDLLKRVKADFKFLIDKIMQSGFEYDLQIRGTYFNLYYKGNSIGKISYAKSKELYKIEIHNKFINNKIKTIFNPQIGEYLRFSLPREQLHRFYSSANLSSMAQKVKKVNFKEELTFEQMLITDNINRPEFIIIDRQIADKVDRNQMDLLALIRKKDNDYQFCVIEVKLGNNPELREKICVQLGNYVNKVKKYFKNYKKCYQEISRQKQQLGLIDKNLKVNIVKGVSGMVVVIGYSGIANRHIKELKQKAPEIRILHLKNTINLSKVI